MAKSLSVTEWIRWGEGRLNRLDQPGMESRALMGFLLGSPTAVWSRGSDLLRSDTAERFQEWVERRAAREPFHLIVGEVPFYGRSFLVRSGVLIPRPETEHLVSLAVDHIRKRPSSEAPPRFLDLGSGSGIIALTVLLECPNSMGVAVEKDPDALRVLLDNRRRFSLECRLAVVQGHWGKMLGNGLQFDCILSNPPYIPTDDILALDPEVRDFEPKTALDGGQDGLSSYREILSFAPGLLKDGGLLAFEIGADQAEAFLGKSGNGKGLGPVKGLHERPTIMQDVSGRDRVIFWIK